MKPKLILRDLFWLALVVAMATALAAVGVDSVMRIATFDVFAEGHGVPTVSPPHAFETAERNVAHIRGLVTGVAASVAFFILVLGFVQLVQRRAH